MRYDFTGRMLEEILTDATKRGGPVDRWYAFPQTWGSTSLGFDGIGGQAITRAQTVVVLSENGAAVVYFGGRFAYSVDYSRERFWDALWKRTLPAVGDKGTIVERERED